MRVQSKTVATVVAVLLSLAIPLAATANPGIVIVPTEHHFGEVELQSSVSVDIKLTNDWYDTLIINDVFMETGSSPDFTFALPPLFNGEIPPMESIEIQVTYSPSTLGYAAAVLFIDWTNGDSGISPVELDGTGIEAPGGPVSIEDILAFFDAGVEAGTINGKGPGRSGRAHLKVFKFTLLMVAFFIDKGWERGACKLLWHAYARSDGQKPPKDWIEGGENVDDVPELNTMILELLTDLGCL